MAVSNRVVLPAGTIVSLGSILRDIWTGCWSAQRIESSLKRAYVAAVEWESGQKQLPSGTVMLDFCVGDEELAEEIIDDLGLDPEAVFPAAPAEPVLRQLAAALDLALARCSHDELNEILNMEGVYARRGEARELLGA